MSSTPKTPVHRHFYRCPECEIASHIPSDVQDERDIDCTICGYEGPAKHTRCRVATIPTSRVKTGDEVVMDYHDESVSAEAVAYHESDRECPCCLKESLCSPWEAKRVFRTADWGATAMLDDADLVCSFCHVVQIGGRWQRMETLDARAYTLSQSSQTKDSSDYRRILTRGIEPGAQREKPTADDAEGW